jgi:hypothetical protein
MCSRSYVVAVSSGRSIRQIHRCANSPSSHDFARNSQGGRLIYFSIVATRLRQLPARRWTMPVA